MILNQLLKISLITSFVLACHTEEDTSSSKGIIGNDDRIAATTFDSVGIVEADGRFCNGSIVSPNHVITAKHCIDDIGGKYDSVGFLFKDQNFKIVDATFDGVKDLVFLELERDIPNVKVLKIVAYTPSDNHTLRGYERIFRNPLKTSQGSLEIIEEHDQHLAHSFDTEEGFSGAPILNQNGDLVAIHLGESIDRTSNIAARLISNSNKGSIPGYTEEACAINNISIGGFKECVQQVNQAQNCIRFVAGGLPPLLSSFDIHRNNLTTYSNSIAIPQCAAGDILSSYGFNISYPRIRYGAYNFIAPDMVMTMGNSVFFPDARAPSFLSKESLGDMDLLLHELEHVKQYRDKSVSVFLSEYICDTGRNINKVDRLRIHDSLNIEVAANAKSDAVLRKVMKSCDLARNGTSYTGNLRAAQHLKRGDNIKSSNGDFLVSLSRWGTSLHGVNIKESKMVFTINFDRVVDRLQYWKGRVVAVGVDGRVVWQSSISYRESNNYRFSASNYSGGLVLQVYESGPGVYDDKILVLKSNQGVKFSSGSPSRFVYKRNKFVASKDKQAADPGFPVSGMTPDKDDSMGSNQMPDSSDKNSTPSLASLGYEVDNRNHRRPSSFNRDMKKGIKMTRSQHGCSWAVRPLIYVFSDGVVYANRSGNDYNVFDLSTVRSKGCRLPRTKGGL